MAAEQLTPDELCVYFESLPPGRRELVWTRCERQLGCPVDDLDPEDCEPHGRFEEIFDQVLTDMWAKDQLERLVQLDVLHRTVGPDGQLTYTSNNR